MHFRARHKNICSNIKISSMQNIHCLGSNIALLDMQEQPENVNYSLKTNPNTHNFRISTIEF